MFRAVIRALHDASEQLVLHDIILRFFLIAVHLLLVSYSNHETPRITTTPVSTPLANSALPGLPCVFTTPCLELLAQEELRRVL